MFYGIQVSMFVLDTDKHHLPHIHVRYNEFRAVIGLPEGELLDANHCVEKGRLNMTPDVVQVRALPNYCIEAVFADGQHRWFDMKPYLQYPAFSALADDNLFMRAHVAYGTVAWSDEIDLSPDTLYLRGQSLQDNVD